MLRSMPRRLVEQSGLRRVFFDLLLRASLCAGLFFFAGLGFAQTEPPEVRSRRAQELSRTTMSPFCPGRTLEACPSPNAAAWRDDIRAWVDEGKSTEEIRQRLRERMPDADLTGAPSTALDAVLPVAVGVGAIVLLVVLLRVLLSRRRGAPVGNLADKSGSSSSADLDERLDRELSALDE